MTSNNNGGSEPTETAANILTCSLNQTTIAATSLAGILPAIAEQIPRYAESPYGLVLIDKNSANLHDVSDSNSHVLVAEIDVSIDIDSYYWPVDGLPVDLYVAGKSACIERLLINELLRDGAQCVQLYQWHGNEFLSPLFFSSKHLPSEYAS